jgi:hypothetical protein
MVTWTRFKKLPKRLEALTETLNGGLDPSNYKKFESVDITRELKPYGDIVASGSWSDLVSYKASKDKAEICGDQCAETLEALTRIEVAKTFMRRRADGDAAYQKDGVAQSGTTATVVDAARNENDDHWNGGYITFVNPEDILFGFTAQIADYDKTSHTLTLASSLPTAPSEISKYRLVVGAGIVSADILTSTALKAAVKDLKKNGAMPFSDGCYGAIVNPDVQMDFMDDAQWLDVSSYSNREAILTGEIGKIWKVRFVEATETPRETVAGVLNSDGGVHLASVFGREAYGVAELEGIGSRKIYVKSPEQLGQPLPMYSTMGWYAPFAAAGLNGAFGVNIMCGVSQ